MGNDAPADFNADIVVIVVFGSHEPQLRLDVDRQFVPAVQDGFTFGETLLAGAQELRGKDAVSFAELFGFDLEDFVIDSEAQLGWEVEEAEDLVGVD